MKQSEIQVGGIYYARVSGRIVPVRVDAIRERLMAPYNQPRRGTAYDVTNLATGRKTTFRSAVKFRGPVRAEPAVEEDKRTAEARLFLESLKKDAKSREPLG